MCIYGRIRSESRDLYIGEGGRSPPCLLFSGALPGRVDSGVNFFKTRIPSGVKMNGFFQTLMLKTIFGL